MFALCSNITIGAYKNVKPVSVKIERSIFQYVDKAVIKLPITARLKQADQSTTTIDTAKAFIEGDAVTIQLGYNGFLKTEFIGFVSRINFSTPCEVECEGYSYQLRKRTYGPKTFVKSKLLDVLKYLVAGTDILLDEAQIEDVPIEKFPPISGQSGTEVFELIKKILPPIYLIFSGRVLYAGMLGLNYKNLNKFPQKPNVKYRLGWNVIKDNDLKLRQAKNQNVTVRLIGEKKDGTKEKVTIKGETFSREHTVKTISEAGESGETKIIKSHAIIDKGALTKYAEAAHLKMSYDGYEGKITTFLAPYCEPAYTATIEDLKYPERSGKYLVESVEVNYSTSGARRSVAIGLKL